MLVSSVTHRAEEGVQTNSGPVPDEKKKQGDIRWRGTGSQ